MQFLYVIGVITLLDDLNHAWPTVRTIETKTNGINESVAVMTCICV